MAPCVSSRRQHWFRARNSRGFEMLELLVLWRRSRSTTVCRTILLHLDVDRSDVWTDEQQYAAGRWEEEGERLERCLDHPRARCSDVLTGAPTF